ncbi:MAG: hypothetical protein ACRDD1_13830 [Planctomycetia bacterium]
MTIAVAGEGQEVEVQVTIVPTPRPRDDGIRRLAGGWVDAPELDAVLEQIQQERKLERRTSTLGERAVF